MLAAAVSLILTLSGAKTDDTRERAGQGPSCRGAQASLVGTAMADQIRGTAQADVIVALGGKDTIDALSGGDTICAGGGNDFVETDAGSDRIRGGQGQDFVRAYDGSDVLEGGVGRDVLIGGDGKTDRCRGGPPQRDADPLSSDIAETRSCEFIRSAHRTRSITVTTVSPTSKNR